MIEFNWVYKRVLQELHFVWAARGLKFKGCAVQAVKQTPNKSSNDNSAQGEGVYDSVGGERRSVHQHISLAQYSSRCLEQKTEPEHFNCWLSVGGWALLCKSF